MRAGRPSDYSDEIAQEVLAMISEGYSLRKACIEIGKPLKTVWSWMQKNEEFRNHYVRAKEESGDADQDKLDEIAEKVLTGELDPQAARVAADIIKWSASKKKPKKYGDRVETHHTGAIGVSELTDEQLARIAAGGS